MTEYISETNASAFDNNEKAGNSQLFTKEQQ